jgi:hypothetical protein
VSSGHRLGVIGLVHFLVLAMLIHTLGGASGGHFTGRSTRR